jgi:hypothetical protein
MPGLAQENGFISGELLVCSGAEMGNNTVLLHKRV